MNRRQTTTRATTQTATSTASVDGIGIARVSLEKQSKQGYSLDVQDAMLRDIGERYNHPIGEILVDAGFEGDDWNRPAINEGIKRIEQGRGRALVFLDTDRFSRDLPGGRSVITRVLKAGGTVVFGDVGAYTDDDNFLLMLNIKLAIGESQKRKTKRLSRWATEQKVRDGEPHGGRAPYGYRFVRKAESADRRNRFVIDDEQAQIVRRMFQWADEGASLRQIVRKLIALKLKPPVKAWNATWASKRLHDRTYVGAWHYNKSAAAAPTKLRKLDKVRHRQLSSATRRPESEWLAGVKVDAIIERDQFERVQRRLASNVNLLAGQPSDKYVLKGLVRCGALLRDSSKICGERASGRMRGKHAYYRCDNRCRITGKHLCFGDAVRGDALESAVWAALKRELTNESRLERLVAARLGDLRAGHDPREIAKLRAQFEDLKRVEIKARREALRASDDVEIQRMYEQEIAQAKAQRAEVQRLIDQRAPASSSVDVKAIVKRALKQFGECTREQKQQIMQQWVSRVTFCSNEIEIDVTLTGAAAAASSDTNGLNCKHELAHVHSSILLQLKERLPEIGRAQSLTADERRERARKAIATRWAARAS